MCRSRETANRVKCASSLRQVGQAMLLYANENKGAYPRTIYSPGPDPKPVWGTGFAAKDPFSDVGPQPNDVSAIMFLLMRTQDIGSEIFACPSSNAEKDLFGGGTNTAKDRSNFTSIPKNLAYSIHNPYAKDGTIRDRDFWSSARISPDFAIAADINPGTKGTGNNVTAVRTTSTAAEMKNGNSNNHDRDGQNVLYGDGHVEFQTNPFVGIERDNIYVTQAGVLIGSPENENDSILLPTDD